jgi:hypothetical protein
MGHGGGVPCGMPANVDENLGEGVAMQSRASRRNVVFTFGESSLGRKADRKNHVPGGRRDRRVKVPVVEINKPEP